MNARPLVDLLPCFGARGVRRDDGVPQVFVSRLRARIERPGGPHYIQTERGLGYRFTRPTARPAAASAVWPAVLTAR
ncbi:winged helix-turn-helix domain-containing protein, partial [Klebsiella aerogenes]|uniref:winged helix-turn-helix domain-containing protein n=1 Tax=Klebsiella aerogenes TaxID=548 RepID=UPI0034DB4012